MTDAQRQRNEELDDLKKEIDNFQQEKERVRAIVGQIGGMPTFKHKFWNILFFALIIVCFAVSALTEGKFSILMIDIGLAALSVKLLVLMHYMSKVNHFQLWVLSSIEWRINELRKSTK